MELKMTDLNFLLAASVIGCMWETKYTYSNPHSFIIHHLNAMTNRGW